jgi:hypothetical protein
VRKSVTVGNVDVRGIKAVMPNVKVTVRQNSKIKYTHIITTDPKTVGYGSNFILIKHPKQIWGFHLVWVNIGGEVRSATAAMPVTLGRLKEFEFGDRFLGTFRSVLERVTGVEHVLGNTKLLRAQPEWGSALRDYNPDWSGYDTVNALLYIAYSKMWDLDVQVVEKTDVPADVWKDYEMIFENEFEGESVRFKG